MLGLQKSNKRGKFAFNMQQIRMFSFPSLDFLWIPTLPETELWNLARSEKQSVTCPLAHRRASPKPFSLDGWEKGRVKHSKHMDLNDFTQTIYEGNKTTNRLTLFFSIGGVAIHRNVPTKTPSARLVLGGTAGFQQGSTHLVEFRI